MATIIRTLETTAGFLEKKVITFTPGFNCIIGARGTCKSTIVETLRFAFLQENVRDSHLLGVSSEGYSGGEESQSLPGAGIITATLSPGSVIVQMSSEGDRFAIERDTRPTAAIRAYKDGVPWSDVASIARQAEIYSQGELYLIAKDASRRMALVDRPHAKEIQGLREEHAALVARIAELGRKVRDTRIEVSKRKAATSQLSQLKEALSALQQDKPAQDDDLQREHELFLHRERLRGRIEVAARETQAQIDAVLRSIASINEYPGLSEELQGSITAEASRAARYFGEVQIAKKSALELFTDLSTNPINIEALKSQFGDESREYYSLRDEAKERQEVLKREAAYREEIARYERLVEEFERFEAFIQTLLSERDTKRAQANNILSRILELRMSEINRINEQHHERILLTLQPPADFSIFWKAMRNLLQGSNLRDQESIASQLAQTFTPEQIVRIVESQDARHVAEMLERDLAQINRLLSHLADHKNLYDLEEMVADDVLEITLYDKGKPKGMTELSKGQMATALLPLILRDDPYPLVIDQPEDDLDNSFIFETLVRIVSELKSKRQLIFVTHNANLPVLGEAENVIVMKMEGPMKADTPAYGNVDQQKESILGLLEGGLEAFKARASRYASVKSIPE